eukprot:Phypoly_transcript_02928.p1 GENE.Phypoly_transcript_02928~~Phypoly_transcript_02928.p1  ORF type:complete len:728 (+),score=71.15 Phypoly_transcript_02928:209-2392(+)
MNVGLVNQARLENALNHLFPSDRLIKNARKAASIKNSGTGEFLEVDLWYPNLNLGFEFQDSYHYHPTWYCQVPLSVVQERDNTKRDLLLQYGYTLVLIPCWWNGTLESLQATINFHRPDIFSENFPLVIPCNPFLHFFPVTNISKNTQLMLASFPSTLELVVASSHNQWWLGEKYDGVRCYWRPNEKQLYSRQGLVISIYSSSVPSNLFGDIVMDGEIWCGRGFFLESQTIVSSTPNKVDWGLLRVVCFDEASEKMAQLPFEQRYTVLLDQFAPGHPTVIIAMRLLCTITNTLARCLKWIVEEGGEGVVLRKPLSRYICGRTNSLLKLKASKADQEALVVSVEEDGSLLLQLPNSTRFIVAKENCVLHRQVVHGDIVSFTYDFTSRQASQDVLENDTVYELGVLHNTPSNPTVYRVRDDLFWEDVLLNSLTPPSRHFLNDHMHQKLEQHPSTKQPRGYWGYNKGKHMRSHLEAIAREHGIDPLVASDWYCVSRDDFMVHREFRTLMVYYGSLTNALVDLFPELHFDLSLFSTTPKNFWQDQKNRRMLYERFAKSKGGDPLNSHFWYSQTAKEFLKFKGGVAMKDYYSGFVTSVIHIFPELHLKKPNFKKPQIHIQKKEIDVNIARKIFNKFAAAQGFDPLIPDNWYNVSNFSFGKLKDLNTFLFYKKMRYIVKKYFKTKFASCLIQLYPNIGIQKSKFNSGIFLLSYYFYFIVLLFFYLCNFIMRVV